VKKLVLIVGIVVFSLWVTACPTGANLDFIDEAPSLAYIWGEHFPLGNIISPGYSRARMALLSRHFDILTAENHMKPDHVQPSRGSFNFATGQTLISDANRAGIGRFHGHTLAWHSQSPWHLNQQPPPQGSNFGPPIGRDEAIENLRYHIDRTMRAFPSVESWDVLNEIFSSGGGSVPEGGNWRNNLRMFPGPPPGSPPGTLGPQGPGTPWARAIGTFPHNTHDPNRYCYIWISFMQARRTAYAMGRPDMILYYNDYNEEQPGKREAIFFMVRDMNAEFARRFPTGQYGSTRLIDAIGMQAHYHRAAIVELGENNNRPPNHGNLFPVQYPWATNIPNVRAALLRFAELDGVLISITELDITVGNAGIGNFTPRHEREQAITYARVFNFFHEFAAANPGRLRRVSIWGLDDPSSWRWRGSPVLFDGNFRPKEAFWAVAAPDAFVDPVTGVQRSEADINAFLADPRAATREDGTLFIPEGAWEPGSPRRP